MRHQHRHRHRAQDFPGRAAENEFAQSRMAIAAHDDEIGAGIGGMRENHAGDIDIPRRQPFDLDLQAVAGKVMRDVAAPAISLSLPGSPVTVTTSTALARARNGMRVGNGPGGAAAAVPAHHHSVQLERRPSGYRARSGPAGLIRTAPPPRSRRSSPAVPGSGWATIDMSNRRAMRPNRSATPSRARGEPAGFGGQPLASRRLLEFVDGCLCGRCGLRHVRLDDVCDGPVEDRPRHDRLIGERDGGEMGLEAAGDGRPRNRVATSCLAPTGRLTTISLIMMPLLPRSLMIGAE